MGIALISLITGPLCARMLGPAGRGELAALQNLYWFVAVVSMLGIPEATLYFTARRKEESGNREGKRNPVAVRLPAAPVVTETAYLSSYPPLW